jgi:hypothetical protein
VHNHLVACFVAILLTSDVGYLPVGLSYPALVSPDRLKEGVVHFEGVVNPDDALMMIPLGVESYIDQNQGVGFSQKDAMIPDILLSNSLEVLETHIVEGEVWPSIAVNVDILKDSQRFGVED